MDMDASAGYSGQLWKTNKVDQVEDDLARQIFARLCQDGSPLVVDVGANIGHVHTACAPASLQRGAPDSARRAPKGGTRCWRSRTAAAWWRSTPARTTWWR